MDHAVAEWLMRAAGIGDDDVQGGTGVGRLQHPASRDTGTSLYGAGDRMSGATADRKRLRRLLRDARAAREALTQNSRTPVQVARADGSVWEGALTRAQLQALVEPLIDRTLPPCRRVLRDAGLRADEVLGVVLVGGATRMPRVREKVAEFFGRAPLADIDPDRVAEQTMVKTKLQEAVSNLPERERIIVQLYYIESKSLKSIGQALGISESRASQLRQRALRRLRAALMEDMEEAA